MTEKEPILFPRLRQRLKERREGTSKNKDIVDLMRSQFSFSCPICEQIAEKVSVKFEDRVKRMQTYEAVYKMSSSDKKSQDEAMATLRKLGLLQDVNNQIRAEWQKIKEREA